MEAILSCGVPTTLKTIWESVVKLNPGGVATSQKLCAKDERGYKESFSTGGFLPKKDPLCLV